MNIFTKDEVLIFANENGWDLIFKVFEQFMQEGNVEVLENMNDPNINVLLKASKQTGAERKCTLLQHAVRHFT